MSMPTLVPPYTAAEIRRFPDDRLRYLAAHSLGEALPAPFEVEFAEDTAVQPDVLVILEAQRERLTPERLLGPPAVAIEIISFSSKRTDRLQKRS